MKLNGELTGKEQDSEDTEKMRDGRWVSLLCQTKAYLFYLGLNRVINNEQAYGHF